MLIQDAELGRVELRDVPLPEEMKDFFGTYTYSGRVLVSYHTDSDPKEGNWVNVATVNDDGTDLRTVFAGDVPRLEKDNGLRWMCFPDNKRIHLGFYVMECEPSLDACERAELVRVYYPEELEKAPGVFAAWSEIIMAPDNEHMCWTMLTMNGATNYLGRLVRLEDRYVIEDVCVVSTTEFCAPDPEHEGAVLPLPVRGGEVKQFIMGGRGLTMVGNSDSITDSVAQALDSEEILQITHTPGYEETTIFSADEKLGLVMSTRFSPRTNCAVFGLLPQPNSIAVRAKMINTLYMYCVAGVRGFRKGNVGPALIDIERSRAEGRAYQGVNLSDPEGRWVYYSPMSWHPDSTRAMWNERTRRTEEQRCRLRICHLLDRAPGVPVPTQATPRPEEIPYAAALSAPNPQPFDQVLPMRIMGKVSGQVFNERLEDGSYRTRYERYSDDGESFFEGYLRVQAPGNMFAAGDTILDTDLRVSGAHTGEMKLHAVFQRADVHAPAMLSPESQGWASYDGVTLRVEDMEA